MESQEKITCSVKECGKNFETRRERNDHIKLRHDNCVPCPHDNCLKRLKSSSFDLHIRMVHEKRYPNIPCSECGKIVNKRAMYEHVARCISGGVKKFTCTHPDCASAFTTPRGLSDHNRNVHKPRLPCPVKSCDAKVRPTYLSSHIKLFHSDYKRTCKKCGKVLSPMGLTPHMKICQVTAKKTFRCTHGDCKATFAYEKYRSLHVKNMHLVTPVNCPYENCQVLVKPKNMNSHIKSVHKKVMKACSNCGKLISYVNIRHHVNRCGKEKNIPCSSEDCEATFATRHDLKVHFDRAHKARVKCPRENCGVFLKYESLEKHVKSVHDKVREECSKCGKKLSIHQIRIHEKQCGNEGKSARTLDSWIVHKNLETESDLKQCKVVLTRCDAAWFFKYSKKARFLYVFEKILYKTIIIII